MTIKSNQMFRCQICSFLLTIICSALCSSWAFADESAPRQHLLLDANWKFHLGDTWPNALVLDKAGASTGPARAEFNDNTWRTINLPHDWAIELPFDQNASMNHGFKPVGPGFPDNSVGWYRRTFDLPAQDSDKRLWLNFDGVFRDATVWVNGWLMGRHEGGYYPFGYDITDFVRFGGPNTIAVRVDAGKFEGWFYEGAGIYRHVWLDKTSPVAIAPDGVFVWSEFENNTPGGSAEVNIKTKLLNSGNASVKASVKSELFGPDGKSIAFISSETNTISIGENEFKAGVFLQDTEKFYPVVGKSWHEVKPEEKWVLGMSTPVLWSPENPKLYKLITTVSVEGKIVDQKETSFGIRTVAFDKDKGFLLNGQPYELYGTCNHQDMAGVGAALPDALQDFRIRKLKEFGCNAYRTSHNPPTPELLDACDRLGMIVMDENRLLGSDAQNLARWDTEIRRDRNHPSVAIWSVGNEEFLVQDRPQAANVARTMQELARRLDPTRPVTYAAPEGDVFAGINSVIQVRGWNYNVGPDMDTYHAKHPDQPNVGTEQGSTVGTRGIYENDKQRGYVSAYDDNAPSWAHTAETWWSFFADRPWLSGGFVWTGFDYRGEPTPYSWPCINSHFGILDTCGFPKDNFYYYQSWWTTNPVLHLLPHWNWAGKEGQEIRVDAFSNCKSVELFLNGQSLGKQDMQPNSHLTWQVKYAPGTLSAKGFDADGKVIAETKVETTGDAVAIQLTPDRSTISADGEDVSVIKVSAVDAEGRVVPMAQNQIHFELTGPGKILGVGNGDPSCHEADTLVLESADRVIPINDWRWKLTDNVQHSDLAEYTANFDDSAWNKTTSENECSQLTSKQSAVFRRHLKLSAEDLASSRIQIQFGRIDDLGWIYVNGQLVGESHDWSAMPAIDLKKFLHEGDNVVAVGAQDVVSGGGIGLGVYLQLAGHPIAPAWSRSLFNGLAEVIVQSGTNAGELKLTASADGLKPTAVTIQTAAGTARLCAITRHEIRSFIPKADGLISISQIHNLAWPP